MVISSDDLLRAFNNDGFNALRRPNGRLTVLDVLVRDDVLERIGPLQNVAARVTPLPPVTGPTPAVNFAGQVGSQLHITTAIVSLTQWLRALGAGTSAGDGLTPALAAARYLRLRLDAPMTQRTDRLALASQLSQARVDPTSPLFRYLQDRNTDLYVVTEIIHTDRVTFRALDVGSSPVDIDVPALAAVAGPNVKVSTSGAGPSWITCQGRLPVTIAFKCARVRRDHGGNLSIEPDVPATPGREEAVLFAPGTLVAVA